MPAPLDVKKVKKALKADPAFSAALPDVAQGVYLELVDALPAVLKDHLDKRVSLSTLMEAKLALVDHILESDFFEKAIKVLPEDMLPAPAGQVIQMATDLYKQLRTPLMEAIHNTKEFLASQGVTERQLLASGDGGRFNAKTLAAYDKGKLTVQSLLETQPAVLLMDKNG